MIVNNYKYDLLSNYDIVDLCNLLGIKLIDCLPKDLLLKMKAINGGYIINLDNSTSNKGGTHWVSFWIDNEQACYFDPFGTKPPLEFYKFCKGKIIIYSKDQIQNVDQSCCGYYCIAFLHFMNYKRNKNNLKTSLNLFLKPFDLDDTTKNDNVLQEYLKNI